MKTLRRKGFPFMTRTKRFRKFIISCLTSGKFSSIHDETNMDALLRLIVLNIIYTLTSILIIGLGASDMQKGNVDLGLIQLILGFMIFVNLLLLRTELPFMVGGLIVTAIFGSFCGFSIFVKHEIRGLESIWIFSYPLMAIFTLGLPAGIICSLLLFIVILIWIFSRALTELRYTPAETVLICGVYFFVLILTAVYEYVRSYKDRWLVRQESYINMIFENSPDIIISWTEIKNYSTAPGFLCKGPKSENLRRFAEKITGRFLPVLPVPNRSTIYLPFS